MKMRSLLVKKLLRISRLQSTGSSKPGTPCTGASPTPRKMALVKLYTSDECTLCTSVTL